MAKDIVVDVKVTGLADLRTQLKQAREDVVALQSSEIIDPNALAAATKRAGELRDRLNDANEQIKVMSGGSDFEKVSGGLGLIKDQLSNLDFEGAAASAKNLTSVVKGMNPESVAAGFKGLTQTIGQLGNAFFQMGLKLLANPIFLIVAVIAAVVIAIVLLKDKIKIVEIAFDILMKPIKALIQGLKDLSDWLGITSFAEEDAAQKSLEASEKRIAANKKVTDSMDKEYGRQIALAKANGEDTTKLEAEQAAAKQKSAGKNIDDLNKQIATQRALLDNQTREEQKATKEKIADLRKSRDEELEINKDSANQVQVIYANARAKEEDERKKAADKANADAEKAAAKAREYAKTRLDIQRLIKDLELAELNDGVEKTVAINNEKYRRLIEDTQNNEKLLASEKQRLTALYEEARQAENAKTIETERKNLEEQKKLKLEAQKKEEEDFNAHQQRLRDYAQTYNDFIFEKTASELDKKKAAIDKSYDEQKGNEQKRYFEQISDQKLTDAERFRLKVEHLARMKKLEEMHGAEILDVTKKSAGEQIAAEIDKYTQIADKAMTGVNAINAFLNQNDTNRLGEVKATHDAEVTELQAKQDRELSATGLSEAQKKTINEKYARLKYASDLKAWQDSESIKKKQFARDKALRMVGVVIDTAKAISGAVAASPLTFGMPWSAVAAGVGALQLATIASQKYQGEAGPAAPSIGSAGAGGSAPAEPALALYGKNKEDNTATAAKSADATQSNITVTAVVSETEMTATQGKVAKMQKSAEL